MLDDWIIAAAEHPIRELLQAGPAHEKAFWMNLELPLGFNRSAS
jgi:hypothetical protein